MAYHVLLPDGFRLDFSKVMADTIGDRGLAEAAIERCPATIPALAAMARMWKDGEVRGHDEKVYFPRLAYQAETAPARLEAMEAWGAQVRQRCSCLVSLGIGGSYLGNQVLMDALQGPLWNNFNDDRHRPKIFFSGNNLDPASVRDLENIVDLEHTMFLVISKSGTTTETMAAFHHFYELYRQRGLDPGPHFTAVTDPERGILLQIARAEQFPLFEVPVGVGGRWSVLSDAGILLAAAGGAPVRDLLAGARAMDQACRTRNILENPAFLYALICHLLHRQQGVDEVVLMPYCDRLRSFALWYVQLLAESLGKEKNRQGEIVHEGRTPIAALGTTDMHAQTQQHREGKRNKLVTTIAVADFGSAEVLLPAAGRWAKELSFVAGKPFSTLLDAARRANEESLAADGRPSCCLTIPRLDAFTLGQLFLFFELATAFEGELLDVNAFDQPGVEYYKKIMKTILG